MADSSVWIPSVSSDPELVVLTELIRACQSIASTNERVAVFRQQGQTIKPLLALIYDPFQKFHVTSKNLLKFEKTAGANVGSPRAQTLQALLLELAEGQLTGHAALRECLAFIRGQATVHRASILAAINKDLKIRVGINLVNKVFPLLVPVFSCALSHPVENHQAFYEKNKDKWFISRKLDGCRCMFVRQGGTTTAYSRSGHVYPAHIEGLAAFLQQFRDWPEFPEGYVVDGEMGVVNDAGKEFFNVANSIMNPNATADSKKRAQSLLQPGQYLCYFAFDMIPLPTFKAGHGGPKWSLRQKLLKEHLPLSQQIRLLEQHPASQMEALWGQVEAHGWEGLILRLDADYDGKKTRNMLKMKQQADEEFEIQEATSSVQMPPDSTVPTLALEHVGIEYKGRRVWVGGGFTWEQRLQYARQPEALVGKQITVKHYGETTDKTGQCSLRHPSVKQLWLQPRST